MKEFDSHFYEVARVRHHVPRFRFQGDETLLDWQARGRKRFIELLGLPLIRGEKSFILEYTNDQPDVTEYRFSVESEPEFLVPCHLLIPKNGLEKHSLAICFCGHGGAMNITLGHPNNMEDENILSVNPELNMAKYALKEGRAVLVVESRGFGELDKDKKGCTELAKTALIMGQTIIGYRVHDAICALDATLSNFGIDEDDILATGYSGGGTLAFYLACVDERIAICAPSSSFCSYERSIAQIPHCLCNHIPSVRRDFEVGDLAGLIYPRTLIIGAGESDPIFPFEGVLDSYEIARNLYFKDEEGKIELLTSQGGHLYYADLLWSRIADKKS